MNGAPTLTDLLPLILIAGVVTVVGIRLGMVLIAPRISRALDRADANQIHEEPGDRPD